MGTTHSRAGRSTTVLWRLGACVIGAPVYLVLEHLLVATSVRRTACGLSIHFMGVRNADNELATMEVALGLIRRLDPRRFEHLQRDVKRVFVVPSQRAFMSPVSGSCFVVEHTVKTKGPVVVASQLVHEAIHARLRKRGIGYPPELRMRTEELCCRQEIAFAELIPRRECPDKDIWLDVLHRRLREYPGTV